MKPIISVVVPVYNVENYLVKCLDSICSQILTDLEIILVDDGSTDNSGKMCDEYACRDTRIQVIHKANGGLVSARKAGVNAATGMYIGFVDSDDWIEKEMFSEMYALARENEADIVAGGVIEDVQGKCCERVNSLATGLYQTASELLKLRKSMLCAEDYFGLGIQPYLWNKLIRRELALENIVPLDERIRVGEDAAVTYPVLAMARRVVITDKCHYHYCLRSSSMMFGKAREEKEYAEANILEAYLRKRFAELGVLPEMEEQLKRYHMNNLLVRTFGKIVHMNGAKECGLYPFKGIYADDSIVIYGAGAFGRAVYQYAKNVGEFRVKAWVDQNAEMYRELGMDVKTFSEVRLERIDKVLIAVLSERVMHSIKRFLVDNGVAAENIFWIELDTE